MRYALSLFLCLVTICGLSVGQCSALSVSGSVNPGQTIAISLSGAAANAIVVLAAGPNAGSTTIPFPGSPLVLGLADPFITLPLGMSDASGNFSLSVGIPADAPANMIPNQTLTVQAVSVAFSMMPPFLSFCVSNTTTLVSGNG